MDQDHQTPDPTQIDKHLRQLSRMADRINNSLAVLEVPENVSDSLSDLSDSLLRISRRITHQQEERDNLHALADIGQVVNSSLELNEVLRIVMDTIVRLTGAERGFLMLKEEDGVLSISIARNWEQETLNPDEFAISRTIINQVVSDGRSLLTTNAQEDPRFGNQESVVALNLRSILCVPLKVKEDLIGVIYTDNRVRTGLFSEAARDLLNAFANQAAVAIQNPRLFDSVRQSLAEVTELKNLMDNVFASIASGVITTDNSDNITLCNRAAETIVGFPAGQIIGHPFQSALPHLEPYLNTHIQTVRQCDTPIIGLVVNPVLNGKDKLDLHFNISPLKDADQNSQGVAIVMDDLTERKQLEAHHRMLKRMVPPAIIDQLDPNELQLGGKRAAITTLFADVRGFTSFSEELNPEHLVAVLNIYLAGAAEAVLAQGGTVDKFMGDAVMAWFNAPIPQKDHTLRAVKAALGIRDSVRAISEDFPAEFHLSFGVGIHFGDAVLGLVGTKERLDYTAIGDSINTAKRIQENTSSDQILISMAAYQLVEHRISVEPAAAINAKGKSRPIEVFEVVSLR